MVGEVSLPYFPYIKESPAYILKKTSRLSGEVGVREENAERSNCLPDVCCGGWARQAAAFP